MLADKQNRATVADHNCVTDCDHSLVFADEVLELRASTHPNERGIFVDFSHVLGPQITGISKNQLLGRAVGKKTKTVLDATAGLGKDAALLAAMGYNVTSIERSPVLFALLQDGLRRAMLDDKLKKLLGDRLTFFHADARDILKNGDIQPDAVYIDPMFPPKRKASALAKKSVRIIRKIVGNDDDAADLVKVARAHARRVVIKYPSYSQPLADNPTVTFVGKLVRYDVYVKS